MKIVSFFAIIFCVSFCYSSHNDDLELLTILSGVRLTPTKQETFISMSADDRQKFIDVFHNLTLRSKISKITHHLWDSLKFYETTFGSPISNKNQRFYLSLTKEQDIQFKKAFKFFISIKKDINKAQKKHLFEALLETSFYHFSTLAACYKAEKENLFLSHNVDSEGISKNLNSFDIIILFLHEKSKGRSEIFSLESTENILFSKLQVQLGYQLTPIEEDFIQSLNEEQTSILIKRFKNFSPKVENDLKVRKKKHNI